MRELLDGGEVEKSGKSFDGVKSPENGVDRLGVQRVLLEREQLSFERREMFPRLHDEVGDQFGILIEHQANGGSHWRHLRRDELLQIGKRHRAVPAQCPR